jgi:hypothetical protein
VNAIERYAMANAGAKSVAKGKASDKKLSLKKQPIKDLDVLKGGDVKGGGRAIKRDK